ncbi:MAG: hypothetical protein KJP01_02270 [Gramella sp.]|nr:hypothetical protein [Christiangramia sp.]
MKKSIYFLMMFVGLALTSCEPMEDIHAEVDANLEAQSIEGVVDYTLTDEDYDELDLTYGNFSNVDDAKEMIPGLLSNKYPVWGKGSLANVTFKLYAPKRDERSLIVYEVTDEDYEQYGDDDFASFDREWQVMDLIEDKFADAENRTLVSLTYDYYDGGLQRDVNNGFLLLNGEWMMITGLTEDEYAAMGESYPNFSSEDEAEAKLPIFLNEKMKYGNPKGGDITSIMYKLYTTDEDDVDGDGRTDDRTTYSYVKYFVYNGSTWAVYNNVVNESLQFGHDGTTWVPDNTIKYTFEGSDYGLIGNEFIDQYPGPGDNVAFFSSFDRRSSSDNYWNDAMLLEAMNFLLDRMMPSAEDGQKYEVTFDTYVGSTVSETLYLVKDGGVWIYQE